MEYRRLGKSGLQVSTLSFGSWLTFGKQLDYENARALMFRAYDHGINFFDNAEQYAGGKSEEVMGRILDEAAWDRSTYLVSSKVFWGGDKPNQKGLSRKHVIEACHAALRRLRVDYLDLYFCHRPDINTPVEETVRAMSDLIQQGYVLYWGTSEWSAQEIQEAYSVARQYNLVPPTMEQPQYHLFHRERVEKEYHKLYTEIGLGTTTWSPLASGILTGKYVHGVPTKTRATEHPELGWLVDRLTGDYAKSLNPKVLALNDLAHQLGATLPQLAIAWCTKFQHISTVITGASRLDQLDENMKALDIAKKLTPEVIEQIEAIVDNKPKFITY